MEEPESPAKILDDNLNKKNWRTINKNLNAYYVDFWLGKIKEENDYRDLLKRAFLSNSELPLDQHLPKPDFGVEEE